MNGHEDDQGLVEACRAGRTEAFGRLVMRYKDRLNATLVRLTGSAEDAQDLVQDAFVRAYQKLEHFQGSSSFYTWVYRIAVNLALSERRKRKSPLRLSDFPAFDPADSPDDSEHSDPTARLERLERAALVQRALLELAPEFRKVVVLKDLEGMRYEEIAEVLEVPVGTVRSRLHRGRCDLRGRLEALLEGRAGGRPERLGRNGNRNETGAPEPDDRSRVGLDDPVGT
jgi:RNA polymerase sigma-70 factor (ECF subfamily)